jgi:hypothetical protein
MRKNLNKRSLDKLKNLNDTFNTAIQGFNDEKKKLEKEYDEKIRPINESIEKCKEEYNKNYLDIYLKPFKGKKIFIDVPDEFASSRVYLIGILNDWGTDESGTPKVRLSGYTEIHIPRKIPYDQEVPDYSIHFEGSKKPENEWISLSYGDMIDHMHLFDEVWKDSTLSDYTDGIPMSFKKVIRDINRPDLLNLFLQGTDNA